MTSDGVMSPADYAAINNGGGGFGGFGGGDAWVLIILFALIFGNNGFLGGGGGGHGGAVTQYDLCSSNSFTELKNSVGRLSDQVGQTYTGLQNGLSNLGYETLSNFNTLGAQIAECCCTTQRAIDGVNYNGAINTSNIIQAQERGTQKILDALCTNRMADMQNQINQLQLQAALCGVIRYPTTTAFSTPNPFFNYGCGCGCGTNI